jgi:hypothetical protein
MEKIMVKKDADYSELKKIAQKYGVSRSTLWRARKRGYFCAGYHKREIEINDNVSDTIVLQWYDLAWKVYYVLFRDYIEQRDDLIQEAVIRLWELSGKKEMSSFGYKWSVCVNAMRSWLRNGFSKRLSDDETDDYVFEIDCIDESYLNFELWEAVKSCCEQDEVREIQEFVNGNKTTLSKRVKSKLFKLLTGN